MTAYGLLKEQAILLERIKKNKAVVPNPEQRPEPTK
jgi:hypothetical protein